MAEQEKSPKIVILDSIAKLLAQGFMAGLGWHLAKGILAWLFKLAHVEIIL